MGTTPFLEQSTTTFEEMPCPGPISACASGRDVLRLRFGEGLSLRQIAASVGLAQSTVGDQVRKAVAGGLGWPLPDDMDDDALQARLHGAPVESKSSRPEPDWPKLHIELRRPHVTLMLLWLEYKETFPDDGYAYSQFCEHYRIWRSHIDVVMRQHHRAGEKMFVDFPGRQIPIYDERTGEIVLHAEFPWPCWVRRPNSTRRPARPKSWCTG